ncbi:Bug family tripartite tricarboxylate transporter substrate binding protein [Nonomuraea endophytica]|uniref:Putative tricarboxylic transport membrane protein n=1 Tax=Nonomuraea endophytica TaxID=714136 RepID=A0A7W8A424_9ACTN|nr:tripartite tricarboxylate transporter substrate-binding protein [Nonomuraea endophytica]MBB5077943.1 putative tricarboxylic transport membrane protein [Nonomuraea endophytica]
MRRRQFFALGLGLAACASGCATAGGGGHGLGPVGVVPGGERWAPVAQALFRTLRRTGYPATGTGGATTVTVTGLPALAAAELNDQRPMHVATTPLARLTGNVEVLVVPANSRLKDFDAFAAHLLAQPERTYLAGGPLGEPDHLLFGLIAQGLGVDVRKIDYTGYPGAQEVAAAMQGGKVAAATGRLRDWRARLDSGRIRPLAVSSAVRVPGVEAPTLLECGVRVDFADWCAAVGPAAMDRERRGAAVRMMEEATRSAPWHEACRNGGWEAIPLSGDDFATWLATESARTRRVLRELGMLDTPSTTYRG